MLLNIHILGIINYWVQIPANLLERKIKYIYDNNKSINLSTLGMKGRCNSIYTRVFTVSSSLFLRYIILLFLEAP